MPRFFIDKNDIVSAHAIITGDDAHHISKVLRMKPKEKITLCDGDGFDYEADILNIDKSSVEVRILNKTATKSEPDIDVVLFQGIPKSGKMEYIIQKCTELGINKIVPCIMDRCVVKLNKNDIKKKTQRYQSVALAAAKQSGRGKVPKIEDALSFDEALISIKQNDLYFVPYENETGFTLKDLLKKSSNAKSIAFIIGPEGGISEREIEKITKEEISTVTLGERILRTETAGAAVLAMIDYEFLL